HHGARGLGGDEVLDEDLVLEHADLGHDPLAVDARFLAHHHDAVHGLAPGEELGLGQDRLTAAARLPAVPATLSLGLQPSRTGDALHLVRAGAGALSPAPGAPTAVAFVDLGVGRLVVRAPALVRAGAGAPVATTTTATPPRPGRGRIRPVRIVAGGSVARTGPVVGIVARTGPRPGGGVRARLPGIVRAGGVLPAAVRGTGGVVRPAGVRGSGGVASPT